MDYHSCEHCEDLMIDLEGWSDPDIDGDRERKGGLKWRNIHEADKGSCLLLRSLLRTLTEEKVRGDLGATSYLKMDISIRRRGDIFYYAHMDIGLHLDDSSKRAVNESDYNLLCSEGDPLASEGVFTRPFDTSPDQPRKFELARSWIHRCITSHVHESSRKHAFVPTRLLCIERNNSGFSLRLTITKGKEDRQLDYTALSYCWGGDQKHKLTKERLEQYTKEITYETLPKTIRDSIKVTAELGYEYIWIDSLCIIQDDDEDKSHEIAAMLLVYGSAVVTIAATRANAVTEGFLQPYDQDGVANGRIAVRFDENKIGSVGLALPMCRPNPLEVRAWTLQERLLSVRMLDYLPRALEFSCPGMRHDLSSSTIDGWRPNDSSSARSIKLASDDLSFLPIKWPGSESFRTLWRSIVEDYTDRGLTVASDRSLAISGVAAKLANIRGDSYVAGLWKACLPVDLLWRPYTPMQSKPLDYQGPSWSWIPIMEQIHFQTPHKSETHAEWMARATLEVLDVYVVLKDDNAPFGAVAEARLTVKGRLVPLRYEFFPNERRSFNVDGPSFSPAASRFSFPMVGWKPMGAYGFGTLCAFDTEEAREGLRSIKTQTYFLEILGNRTADKHLCGLLLKEAPGGQRRRFSRLGLLTVFSPQAEEDARLRWLEWIEDDEQCVLELI